MRVDQEAVDSPDNRATGIPGTSIEIIEPPETGHVRHALLDFDGTLSMVRDGWQDVMVPLMVDVLRECGTGESDEELEALAVDFVDHLTGKQTIYQMIRLAEEVEKRGREPLSPLEYKRLYNERLTPIAEARKADVKAGRASPDSVLVRGAREFLEELRRRDVRLYLASGTDVEFVREEAEVLDIARYFDGGIFGALPNYAEFSKAKVIRAILSDFGLGGPEILVVGDGYVEIENARAVGAVALGVVSVEGNRYHMNADKRERLIRAGAHLLATPDLTGGGAVLDYLGV